MQKFVNLVDLVKSFPTNIYLQKSASIQPRTSLSKFGGKFNSLFIRLLKDDAATETAASDAAELAEKAPPEEPLADASPDPAASEANGA